MSGIQSSVGLITGIPIQDTVDKLMAVSARPKDLLVARTTKLQSQQAAITELTALVIGVQLSTDQLGRAESFSQSTVSSTQPDSLAVRKTGTPSFGSYQFTPVRQASQQQPTSSNFDSTSDKVGAGQFTLHAGGFLDGSLDLDQANGGTGVARGYITITDRSGSQQNVDLRFVKTASDVVDAINSASGIRVSAKIDGDRLVLTDLTGSTTSNLKVTEVAAGTTARDLGLGSINVSSNSANGSDIVRLSNSTSLRSLLDGRGLQFASSGPSLKFDLADGSSVDFTTTLDAKTANLGQLIDALNSAGTGKFQVSISPSGDSLSVTDLTTGASTLAVSSPTGTLAQRLGFDNAVSSGTIAGDRLRSGLNGALLSGLNGGAGLGTLGGVTITNRNGASGTVNLASAITLGDVVSAINGAGLGVTAQLNDTRTGISIIDTTGGSASNLIIASADGTGSAEKLKINGSVAATKVTGGSLKLQWISEQTTLADLNQGRGVSLGSFTIRDSAGQSATINLATLTSKTVGGVIDKINTLSVDVEARINETGDGILLIDNASGSSSLTVTDATGGTTAKQLGIAGASSTLTVGGSSAKGIDGAKTRTITTTTNTTVTDPVTQINNLDSVAKASVLNLGAGGVRLTLGSNSSGNRGRFAIDSGALYATFSETSVARDALLSLGGNGSGGGIILASSSDKFTDAVEGLELTVNQSSTSSVTISVNESIGEVAKKLKSVVDQFNKVRDKLNSLTAFDAKKSTGGLLFGTTESIRIDLAFTRLFNARLSGVGAIKSVSELGVTFRDDGKLEFDEAKLNEALQTDPAAVKEFFTNATKGFSKKAKEAIDSLSGVTAGVLISKNNSLQTQIDQNNSRVSTMEIRLSKERNRLLLQFYDMEKVISKLKDNQNAVSQVQQLAAGI